MRQVEITCLQVAEWRIARDKRTQAAYSRKMEKVSKSNASVFRKPRNKRNEAQKIANLWKVETIGKQNTSWKQF